MAPIFDCTYYNSNSKLIISLLIISSKEQSVFFFSALIELGTYSVQFGHDLNLSRLKSTGIGEEGNSYINLVHWYCNDCPYRYFSCFLAK